MDLWDRLFQLGTVFVMFNLAVQYAKVEGRIPAVIYAYVGNFMVATASSLGAAYALIHFADV